VRTLLVVDRIEGKWAVVEYPAENTTFNMPLSLLPDEVREGDMVDLKFRVDKKATGKERKKINELLEGNMKDS